VLLFVGGGFWGFTGYARMLGETVDCFLGGGEATEEVVEGLDEAADALGAEDVYIELRLPSFDVDLHAFWCLVVVWADGLGDGFSGLLVRVVQG